jgi:hypothetical protein
LDSDDDDNNNNNDNNNNSLSENDIKLRDKIISECLVTEEEKNNCIRNYYGNMNYNLLLHTCAVCGERRYDQPVKYNVDIKDLDILQLSEFDLDAFNNLNDEMKSKPEILNIFIHKKDDNNFKYYYLIPEFGEWNNDLNTFTFPVCEECYNFIKQDKVPTYSVKLMNYGNPALLFPDFNIFDHLSIAEDMCISLVRYFGNLVKLSPQGYNTTGKNKKVTATTKDTNQVFLNGHIITFEHDGPKAILNQISLPNVDLNQNIKILFVGPNNEFEYLKTNQEAFKRYVQIRSKLVYEVLQQLKKYNLQYQQDNVIFKDYEDIEKCLNAEELSIFETIIFDDSDSTAKLLSATADIAAVRYNDKHNEDNVQHILVMNRDGYTQAQECGILQTLLATKNSLDEGVLNVETSNEIPEEEHNIDDIMSQMEIEDSPSIPLLIQNKSIFQQVCKIIFFLFIINVL